MDFTNTTGTQGTITQDNGTGGRKVRTIDLLYQAYVDERMESAESGEEQEAIRSLEIYAAKQITAL